MALDLTRIPTGLRDLFGAEYARRTVAGHFLYEKLKSYGYEDISTPALEYFDVFSKDVGTTPSRDLFKLFDKEGNTLVLRPDFTPSVARSVSKYFLKEKDCAPLKLCYKGNVYTNAIDLQGRKCEVAQIGAEIFGDDSIEADADVIALAIDGLLAVGFQDFVVSIGEVDFFKGLCEAAGLKESVEWQLRELFSSKNIFGAKQLLKENNVDDKSAKSLLQAMDPFWGDKSFDTLEALGELEFLSQNKRSLRAIERLKMIYALLCDYGFEKYVNFDFSMLSNYRYYSGIIFKAYTTGIGEPIAKGGRYDSLMGYFGRQCPAIGCMFGLDAIYQALKYQDAQPEISAQKILIVYHKNSHQTAVEAARALRKEGLFVSICGVEENISNFEPYFYDAFVESVIFINDLGAIKRAYR